VAEPTLNQLDAGFTAGRALADSSAIYGHLITDEEVRKWVAVILQAALSAAPTPAAPKAKRHKP
jgi:hypothetical protein